MKEIRFFFTFICFGPYNKLYLFFIFIFKALAEEASEDDVPSDVDMNDPYFAEEAKKIGKPTHICSFQLESKAKKVTWVETM